MAQRIYQENREKLPAAHREIVANLDAQFGAIMHDLWDAEDFNVAPSRMAFAHSIRAKHLDDLTDHDLDYLTFKSMTTMGGVFTLKFLLPRFFAAYFSNPGYGWTVDPESLMGKLDLANIEEWSAEEKVATLEALVSFDQLEGERAMEHRGERRSEQGRKIDRADSPVIEWARGLLKKPRRQ